MREGGEAAVERALAWLVDRASGALEPGLEPGEPHAAFNITVLGMLLGTPLEPDLAGHVLLLEEVSEHLYATDRALFHITASDNVRRVAGIRLGRVSDVLPNDPDFGEDAEAVVRHWCERAGIPFLGRADIGHDSANKVVPVRERSASLKRARASLGQTIHRKGARRSQNRRFPALPAHCQGA